MAYKKKAKKVRQRIETAVVHVNSSFNNTLVSVTTPEGDVMLRGSCGRLQKGSRKGTPFAASQVGSTLAKDMITLGVKQVEMEFKGAGSGREAVARAIQASGISVLVLRDVTPIPHNGSRQPKRRRV